MHQVTGTGDRSTGDRSSGSRGALLRSVPHSWAGKALLFCRPELCRGRKSGPDQLSALAVQGRETVGNLGSEEKVLFGEPGHEELLRDRARRMLSPLGKQNACVLSTCLGYLDGEPAKAVLEVQGSLVFAESDGMFGVQPLKLLLVVDHENLPGTHW